MSNINAKLVSDLRKKTGSGFMDCKKALTESKGNIDAAIDYLRKKGLSAAAKKTDRAAKNGVIALHVSGNVGVAIELNSETDFVAKNNEFTKLASEISKKALDYDNIDQLKEAKIGDQSINEKVTQAISIIGENIVLRRMQKIKVNQGALVSYIHNKTADGMGQIGVMVALESDLPLDELQEIGNNIAMHITAMYPQALNIIDLSKEVVEKEKAIFIEQAKSTGKPEAIIEKMSEGRLRKFYEESVLMEQSFALENKIKVKDYISQIASKSGKSLKITGFMRLQVGK